MKKYFFVVCMPVVLLCAWGCSEKSVWSNPQMWYQNGKQVNEGFADVFYLVSTDIVHEENPDGSVSYVAFNTPQEKEVLAEEMAFVQANVFPDSLNFFSPFYHQLTLEAAGLGSEQYHEMASEVAIEVYDFFKLYMAEMNDGRPVILAGFSQGALLLKELLKLMTPEEYSRIVASYSLGWGINDEDVKTGRVVPAQGPDDTGVCISFNTVSDTSNVWPLVMDNCSHCINPVNWTVTSEQAEFQYDGQNLTVNLDTVANVLVVEGFKESPLMFEPPWPAGCLHHYEILFYNHFLNRNALGRVNRFRESR